MKKSNKLFSSFSSFLLIFGILLLFGCNGNSKTSAINLGTVEGKIVFTATSTQKMGLIMVKDTSEHALAYGIPYHFNDVANTSVTLTGGSNVQFSIIDDGKIYTATGISKNTTPTNKLNSKMDFHRMLLLDDHKNSSFPASVGRPGRDHKLGHIGDFMGMAGYDGGTRTNTSTIKKTQYGVYAVEIGEGLNLDTLYLGLPMVSDKLLDKTTVEPDSKAGELPWTDQSFYFTLSDVKLKLLSPTASGVTINPLKEITLVREILSQHWHWYDKAVLDRE